MKRAHSLENLYGSAHLVMDVVVATEVEVRTPFVVKVAVVALAVEDAGPVGREPRPSNDVINRHL